MPKTEFVATATAIGVVVDLARMPVYFVTEGQDMQQIWWLIAIATAGCTIGTVAGKKLLSLLPEKVFRSIIFGLILLLGAYMTTQAKQND